MVIWTVRIFVRSIGIFEKMRENDTIISFLYKTAFGRSLLKLIRVLHADQLAVRFLCSSCSRPFIGWYALRHGIQISRKELALYRSFRDFFSRKKANVMIDSDQDHLISPCDGWLSLFPVSENSCFSIKASSYQIKDLLKEDRLAQKYTGGTCMIFRLCAADYHHYCYIDDCYQGPNHYIPGELHSVQPAACEKYPVYVLNRRCWCLLTTEHFGPVIQTEIGALAVGGIVNNREYARCFRGSEKGHFELSGSTIVLLFQQNRIMLRPELESMLSGKKEVRVEMGMWIANGLRERERNGTDSNAE